VHFVGLYCITITDLFL